MHIYIRDTVMNNKYYKDSSFSVKHDVTLGVDLLRHRRADGNGALSGTMQGASYIPNM